MTFDNINITATLLNKLTLFSTKQASKIPNKVLV